VTLGVVVGLVAGKTIGISAAAWLATRRDSRILPDGVSWRQVTGAATLGGIGFTVSLFITGKIWATSPYFSASPSTMLRSSTRPRSASSPPRSPPAHSPRSCFGIVRGGSTGGDSRTTGACWSWTL